MPYQIKRRVSCDVVDHGRADLILYWAKLNIQIQYSIERTMLFSGILHPFFNGVVRSSLVPATASRRIENTKELFRAKGLPFSWLVREAVGPKNLPLLLDAAGFKFCHRGVVAVCNCREERHRKVNTGQFIIQPLNHYKEMRQWSAIYASGWRIPQEAAYLYGQLLVGEASFKPFRHFIVHLEGEAVAIATLFFYGSYASIHNMVWLHKYDDEEELREAILLYLMAHAGRSGKNHLFIGTPVIHRNLLESHRFSLLESYQQWNLD